LEQASTETHLFVIMILVLTFKSRDEVEKETFTVSDYDWTATILFLIFVPGIALACIVHKWKKVTVDEKDAAETDVTHTGKLQKAFDRHRLGRDKPDDRALLLDMILQMEDEVNNHYHVFISYRVKTEAQLAHALYDQLSAVELTESGQKLRVYHLRNISMAIEILD
jgi:hypothetical protein